MRLLAIASLSLALPTACASETPAEPDPESELQTGFATVKVTLLDGMSRGCTSQFSADHDGHPFGQPAEAVALEADPGPPGATLLAYRTDEPPQMCPPSAEPFWTGAPDESADFSDAPIVFGPGSAFTLQVDCDGCQGEHEFQVTLELASLE